MSHYTVLVIGNNPENQLAPFDATLNDWENPKGKWDFHRLGGGWAGHFKLKEGCKGKTKDPKEEPETNPIKDGWADQAKKGDIDFEGTLVDERKRLEKHYVEVSEGRDCWNHICDHSQTMEEYMADFDPLTTHAVLVDNVWYENDEKEDGNWEKKFREFLKEASDDILISLYDIHL